MKARPVSAVLDRAFREREDKEGSFSVNLECLDRYALTSQEVQDGLRLSIAHRQPDDLGRSAVDETELPKVIVFGDDRVRIEPRPLPDCPVCRPQ